MKLSEKERRLTVLIEDEFEWLEIFDSSPASDIISIDVSRETIDFFFPNRAKYINDDDLEQKLIDDANRFDTVELKIADGVMDSRGEGIFEVKGFSFDINSDPDEEDQKFMLPIERETGAFGLVSFTVTPDLIEP